MKILLIGSFPPPLGGTTLTLELLYQALCKSQKHQISIINLVGIRGSGIRLPLNVIRLTIKLFKQSHQADVVSLHVATTALPWAGMIMAIICTLLNKPLIIRKFANTDYEKNKLLSFINKTVIKNSTLFLVETRELLARTLNRGHKHALWFPTHRNSATIKNEKISKVASRFVFLGQVREYKGINELIAAIKAVSKDLPHIQLDVYGPLLESFCEESINSANVRYRGVIAQSQVPDVLPCYDALILPTKAQTEGYPGAVVEALSAGIPVISTTCGAIHELVTDECGLLVTPGNISALAAAIKRLATQAELYSQLREGASTAAF
ncbi:MAG TPA: glycosyltransferase family 4 protein, partial [Pseudomonadales bacterium]|nr:glycosyltransferase family 4 protein [Pseudomonadales bacterium]